MKACVLKQPSPVETSPLVYGEAPNPKPMAMRCSFEFAHAAFAERISMSWRGNSQNARHHIIPGHQVVGTIEARGERSALLSSWGARWDTLAAPHMWHLQLLFSRWPRICATAPNSLAIRVDGGYAEYMVAPEEFVMIYPTK